MFISTHNVFQILASAFVVAAIYSGGFVDCPAAQAQVENWNACLKSPGGNLCFGLELENQPTDESWRATIINGSERIAVPGVSISDQGEILLHMDHYDSTLLLKRVGDQGLEGKWKKRRGREKWVEMQCSATPAKTNEKEFSRSTSRFDGRWSVNFESSNEPAVGIFAFDRTSGQLRGTFLTTTGDYRYLSGIERDDELRLSCFDGAHAFLFSASIQSDGTLKGDFWSSDTWHETWTAKRDEKAKLADSFEATKAIEESIGSLSFPNLHGEITNLADEKFAAPVRIVHVFGSWCPNCHDAANYLAELKKKYEDKISIVGVAFELTGDFDRDAKQVRSYLARHKLDHTVLIGGTSNKAFASKAMKIIDRVRSYPTTIFADSSGKITAVHQGFSGPATGKAFDEQSKRFVEEVDRILSTTRR